MGQSVGVVVDPGGVVVSVQVCVVGVWCGCLPICMGGEEVRFPCC